MTTSSRPVVLTRDQIWQAIEAQRLAVAGLLATLSDEEWRRPSLCEGWTVRDVAAHLTLQQVGLGGALAMITQWRGTLDRTIQHAARVRAAALPTERIVAEIRDTAGIRRKNFGVTYLETLTDILVHGQDIAIPLGRGIDTPPRAAAVATTRMLSMRWPPPLPAAKLMHGFRLIATDTPWFGGDGPRVHGPMAAIMLVCAGRLVALPELSGEGAPALAARLARGREN